MWLAGSNSNNEEKTMQINVEVTQAELSEMDLSAKQLEAAVLENLDRGVDIPDDGGRVYLAGFNVNVSVTD